MSIKTESIKRVLRIEKRTPSEITVWLRPTNEAKAFHCPYCGAFQFCHQHKIVAMVEDDMSQVLETPPISPQCRRCGAIFHCHVL